MTSVSEKLKNNKCGGIMTKVFVTFGDGEQHDQSDMYRTNNMSYLSVFDESPRGVEPNVNSLLYSGTAPSSTTTLSRAWLSTQNDFSISKIYETKGTIITFQN